MSDDILQMILGALQPAQCLLRLGSYQDSVGIIGFLSKTKKGWKSDLAGGALQVLNVEIVIGKCVNLGPEIVDSRKEIADLKVRLTDEEMRLLVVELEDGDSCGLI